MAETETGGLAVTLPWGDQERPFRLPIGAWRKIEAKCNAGPEEIVARLAPSVEAIDREFPFLKGLSLGFVGRYRVDDVREVVFQGLMHGDPDLGPVAAAQLMRDYFDDRPLRENIALAFSVAVTSLDGLPRAEPKPPPGEPQGAPVGSAPAEGSPTPTSTGGVGAAA